MRVVYKSSIVGWMISAVILFAALYFFPDIANYRHNFGETYTSRGENLSSLIFAFILNTFFLGAFCKTVIETDDGFEVHYMFGLQKKWFGKDFLIFEDFEGSLVMPSYPHKADNSHIKLWDGGKKTYIYPFATRKFDQLRERLNNLAEEYYLKRNPVNEDTEESEIMKPNLKIVEDFLPQSHRLFHVLKDGVDWDTRMKARKTASFGVSYDYSGIDYPQTEMHEELVPICDLLEKELGFKPNNCLLNFYEDGSSSLGYHSDSSEELAQGTGVAIISLGAERTINYKNKANREIVVPYKLKSGTLLYMDKAVQEEWLHSIPKEEEVGGRINLTFREIIK